MHYSRVRDIPKLAEALKAQIREFVRIAERHADAPDRYAAIRADMLDLWLHLARQHGCAQPDAEFVRLLKNDLDLNTQGLMVWADRRRRGAG